MYSLSSRRWKSDGQPSGEGVFSIIITTAMKRFLGYILGIVAPLMLLAQTPTPPTVLVIPVGREIDMTAAREFSSGCREASKVGADYVLVHLNTYGGALDAADSIRTAILRLPVPTIAFVDNNAASAGALIALACDSVFMAPGSAMGSATVVNGSGEPMPQKYQSYMANMMRATAEHHGRYSCGPDSGQWRRDPEVAAAMVNPETSLSLTADAAVEAHFADGVAAGIPQVLEQLHIADARVQTFDPSFGDTLLGFLASAGVRAVLVMFILGGIYMEMHTPGLGFAAAVALVATALYFLPMIVTGTMPAWIVLTLIAGIVLIALELFVIPGFGITGITGIAVIVVALCGAAMETDGTTGFSMASLGQALISLGVGSALAVALVLYLTSAHGPRFLRNRTRLTAELTDSDGYIGVDMTPVRYVGQEGRAMTVLRPAGKVAVGNNVFDAVSTGSFVNAGRPVRIVKYENAQLYVVEVTAKDKKD